MEFNAYFDFLIKIACGIFCIDPTEINFKYGNTGQRGGLQEANNKEKVTESKERGLRPLLRFMAEKLNQHIIWPINENFEFDFVGLDAITKEQSAELVGKQVKTYRTIDEIRAEDDLPPLPDGKGEIILDPTFLQWAQIKEGGGMGMEGMPGEMGEGDEASGQEPGAPGGEGDEDEEGGDWDFESLLSQYEGKGDNGDNGGKAKGKPQPKGKKPEAAEKSMASSTVVVDLDL
jgi:hypothetical protein